MEIFGIIGILSFCFAIYSFYQQQKDQKLFKKYVENSFKTLETFNNLIFKVYSSMHVAGLRMMRSIEPEYKKYWHFVFRFETCDNIGLSVSGSDNKEIRVKIKGITPSPLIKEFSIFQTYYICEVEEDYNEFELKKGDLISCFFINKRQYFSKYIKSIIEPKEKYEFEFGSLTKPETMRGGDRAINENDINSRLKDMRSFKI